MRHPQPIDFSRTEKDWVLGGLGAFVPQILCSQADWTSHVPPFKLQRGKDGDTYACTVFSAWSALWMIHKVKFNQDLDKSESFTAVDAGNKPGVGNSFNATDESIRLHWSVPESEKPFGATNTLVDFYAKNTPKMITDALNDLKNFAVQHSWIPTVAGENYSSPEQILLALQSSPVRCGVDGDYHGDMSHGGWIINNSNPVYDHAVDIVAQLSDGSWKVFDSERMTFDIFAPDYKFTGCKIYNLERLSSFELVKEPDEPAVYLHRMAQDDYYAIAGNDILAGGDLLKTFSGTYSNANINHLSQPFDHSKIKGEIKAINY